MAFITNMQSSAERASGPTLSRVQAFAITPYRLTRPKLGRKPVMPQKAAGVTMEPHVSVPSANAVNPAATAAAEPLDEPPAHRLVSHGLRVGPAAEALPLRYPVPPANSIMFSFPSSTTPASCRRLTA